MLTSISGLRNTPKCAHRNEANKTSQISPANMKLWYSIRLRLSLFVFVNVMAQRLNINWAGIWDQRLGWALRAGASRWLNSGTLEAAFLFNLAAESVGQYFGQKFFISPADSAPNVPGNILSVCLMKFVTFSPSLPTACRLVVLFLFWPYCEKLGPTQLWLV